MKIEKQIPIPKPSREKSVNGKWCRILMRMDKGDSFLIKGKRPKTIEFRRVAVFNSARILKIKICTRKCLEGIRIWRIK